MGVYIKGMEMPSGCASCDFANYLRDGEPYCRRLMRRVPAARRLPDCPLVPVQAHGRLIDASALVQNIRDAIHYDASRGREYISAEDLHEELTNAPTIIQAGEDET